MKYFLIIILLVCCACATTSPELRQEKQAQYKRTIPVCIGDAECSKKWDAAQLWIIHNAGYKIQTATNVLIETYNPGHAKTHLAARATKEPIGGGINQILITLWCDNIFGCDRDPVAAAIEFNQYVNAAK